MCCYSPVHPSNALTNDLPLENPAGRQSLLSSTVTQLRMAPSTAQEMPTQRLPAGKGKSGCSCLIQSKLVLTCCCHVPPAVTGAQVLPGHPVPQKCHCSARASTGTFLPEARTCSQPCVTLPRGSSPGGNKSTVMMLPCIPPRTSQARGMETPRAARAQHCTALPLCMEPWL